MQKQKCAAIIRFRPRQKHSSPRVWAFFGLCLLFSGSYLPAQAPVPAAPTAATAPELNSSQKEQLNALNAAVQQATADRDEHALAHALIELGGFYFRLGQPRKTMEYIDQALTHARAAGDRAVQATALSIAGRANYVAGDKQKALDSYAQALAIHRELGNDPLQATMLNNIGYIESELGDKRKAVESLHQALPLFNKVGDRANEAGALGTLAAAYADLGESQKALDALNQALPIYQGMGDRSAQAKTLSKIGLTYYAAGEKQKALDAFTLALPIQREMGENAGVAELLNNIGVAYAGLGERQKALDYYMQALAVAHAGADRKREANLLNNIGFVDSELGEKKKALDYLNQALTMWRTAGDRTHEARTLENIGTVYFDLGQAQKALESFTQALPILRQAGDNQAVAVTLNNIGFVNASLGQRQVALGDYRQALEIQHALPGGREEEARTLNNIGLLDEEMGDHEKALEAFNQSLPLRRATGDVDGESRTLGNLGLVYFHLGQTQTALDFFYKSLPLVLEVNDPLIVAGTFHNLMLAQQADHPGLAVFYGKQAVDAVQKVRGNLQGMEKQLQKSFLVSHQDMYRDLAGLLIDQGRLPEAQEILDLLKAQEYAEFVRGSNTKALKPPSRTPEEEQAESKQAASAAPVIALGQEWLALRAKPLRTPEEDARFQQLTGQLAQANQAMDDFYRQLYVFFGNKPEANREVGLVKADAGTLKSLLAKMPGTVALYTLVGAARYQVIVITGSATIAREYPIGEKALNQKIALLQEKLRDPAQDPRPAAKELYDILVGPVEKDLEQAHAQTLVWALSGALRYLPVAALYDGKQYLAERFANANITSANLANLREKPNAAGMEVVAMGISRKYDGMPEDSLPALPRVAGELYDIVKDPRVGDSHGVLPGSILLDSQFTEKALEEEFSHPQPVVHIASHFVFHPGDGKKSYLLLAGKESAGAGYPLTLAEFSSNPNLDMADTELLTLSACETGLTGATGSGVEVDGLGTTAQLKGARAVLSSLWEVDDSSTGELMADFYRRWAGGNVTKVEALRQAQVSLLEGKILPRPDLANPNAPTSFAHPYYWAPFILMGNWQ